MRKLIPIVAGVVFALSPLAGQDKVGQEEKRDPFRKWLQEDVVYIIAKEEWEIFRKLSTEDEKLAFIEEFWKRRDSDPSTEFNEFREEHFRRIAYANEKFAAGKPGWKTDRGMIYIKFGPPDRRQTNPTGGRVYRSREQLIASDRERPKDAMTALPYEVWEYRYIEGMGQEVSFEFVSRDGGATDYSLVMSADDKDALFFDTGSHIQRTRDRNRGLLTFKGNPLINLENYVGAFRPLPFKPAEAFVSSQVHFSDLPFDLKHEAGVVDGASVCDVAVTVPHRALSFNREIDTLRAEIAIEIFVRDIRKVVVGHRAESLEARLAKAEFKKAVHESSIYRTRFELPHGRYLVEVWLKDVLGDAASFQRTLVIIPKQESEAN